MWPAIGCGRKRSRCWRAPSGCIAICSGRPAASAPAGLGAAGRYSRDRIRSLGARRLAGRRSRQRRSRDRQRRTGDRRGAHLSARAAHRRHSSPGAAAGLFRPAAASAGRTLQRRAPRGGRWMSGDYLAESGAIVAEAEMLSSIKLHRERPRCRRLPPDALIIVPVRNIVLFPGLVLPITLGRARSIAAAQQAVRDQRQIGILMQRDAGGGRAGRRSTCTAWARFANIVRYITAPDGSHHLVCQGEQRFQVVEFLERLAVLCRARAANPRARRHSAEVEARFVNLQAQTLEAIAASAAGAAELLAAIQSIDVARRARRPRRRLHGRQARGEAGDPRDARHLRAHGQGLAAAGAPHRGLAAVAGDRPADQGGARRAPARGAVARADGGDPAPARRRRGGQGRRNGRARQGDHQCRHAEGSRGAGAQGTAPAAAHARSGRPNTA